MRRTAFALVIVTAAVVLGVVLLVHTPFGRSRIERVIENQASRFLNGQFEVSAVSGGIINGVDLAGVTLTQGDITTIRADRVSVHYSILQLLRGESILIDRLRVTGLTVSGVRLPSGALNLSSLLRPRPPRTNAQPRRTIDIREIQIEGGTLTVNDRWGPSWLVLPRRLTGIAATFGLTVQGPDVVLSMRTISTTGDSPAFVVRNFSGVIRFAADGWMVESGALQSAESMIRFNSRITTVAGRRQYDITVSPSGVNFPELARLFPGVHSIDVLASVTLRMTGPDNRLATKAQLQSSAGDISATLTLDSTVPGWSGTGTADVTTLDVSQWLPTDSISAISGHAEFALLLGLGRHFPRGPFSFTGPRAVYLGYEATDVRATGRLVPDRAEIAQSSGTAYGSRFTARGWIGIPAPYEFQLSGDARALDLRRLPSSVPVPRVATTLSFAYDARGRFQKPFLDGSATFHPSSVLGAQVSEGTTGALDTSATPTRFRASGRISELDVLTIGKAFTIETLQDPRYAGNIAGDFTVAGEGTTLGDLDLQVSTNAATISLFDGVFREASFEGRVLRDSLTGAGAAVLDGINPAIPLSKPNYAGAINGRVTLTEVSLPAIFTEGLRIPDAHLSGSAALAPSRVAKTDLVRGDFAGTLDQGLLTLDRASLVADGIDASGHGTIAVAGGSSDFEAVASTQDLKAIASLTSVQLSGAGTVRMTLKGPFERGAVKGTFSGDHVVTAGASVLKTSGEFSGTLDVNHPKDAELDADVDGTLITIGRWTANSAHAKIAYRGAEIRADIAAQLADGRDLTTSGRFLVHTDHNEVHLTTARLKLAATGWEIPPDAVDGKITWDSQSFHVESLALVSDSNPGSRVTIAGDLGRVAPAGTLAINVADVPVESLGALIPALASYRGRLAGRVTVAGSVAHPEVDTSLSVTQGGFRQFTFDTLAVNGGWSGGDIHGDLRLDQAAGRWLTVRGTVPANLFSRTGPSRPVDLAIRSSPIDLGVVQGFTSAVSNMSGLLELDVAVTGVSQDPRFNGFIQMQDAAFLVARTGARYTKGNARIVLTPDKVTIETFRLEDDKGDPLELSGSATTHQLRLGEFAVELSATRFEFLQNEIGDVDLNGVLTISGNPAAPVISADLAIEHARVAADKLLEYFDRPYATTAQPGASDPMAPATAAVSRWWDRTALRLRLQATDNLTLRGDNLRFRGGSAAGLGDVNVTLGGDLTLRKAPGEPISLNGELRTDHGSYAFQGRRFAIDRDGTIRFTGKASAPLISVSASREVAGVKIRVGLTGSTAAPELELSSVPGLEQTDIISLLLFNAPANELVSAQRDALAVQAAALSSGFIVNPAVSAIGRAIGLEFLQIEPEPADPGGTSFRMSAGRSVWRNIFVTYSREFGALDFNEIDFEYSLARFLKIKGSASDAGGARTRSTLFRRVERGGIDLLFFFSY
jgi:autotransporter translocation and assembly factor TamB